MTGTKEGARKTAETNRRKYGDDFYARIGSIGGRNGHSGGFASTEVGADGMTGFERARIAGIKGGLMSTRLGIKNGEAKLEKKYYEPWKGKENELIQTEETD